MVAAICSSSPFVLPVLRTAQPISSTRPFAANFNRYRCALSCRFRVPSNGAWIADRSATLHPIGASPGLLFPAVTPSGLGGRGAGPQNLRSWFGDAVSRSLPASSRIVPTLMPSKVALAALVLAGFVQLPDPALTPSPFIVQPFLQLGNLSSLYSVEPVRVRWRAENEKNMKWSVEVRQGENDPWRSA